MAEVQSPFDDELRERDERFGLWLQLVRTTDVIHRVRNDELVAGGLDSSAQAGILFLVRALGHKATPAEISRHLFRRSHGVSTIISRMENKGLVKKAKDLDRRNMVRVEMTEMGQKACDYAAKVLSIQRIMSALSEDERDELRILLNRLSDRAAEEAGIDKELTKRTLPLGY